MLWIPYLNIFLIIIHFLVKIIASQKLVTYIKMKLIGNNKLRCLLPLYKSCTYQPFFTIGGKKTLFIPTNYWKWLTKLTFVDQYFLYLLIFCEAKPSAYLTLVIVMYSFFLITKFNYWLCVLTNCRGMKWIKIIDFISENSNLRLKASKSDFLILAWNWNSK